MTDAARLGRVAAVAAALLFAFPLAALVLQAFADEWRAPSLLPDRLGLRGLEVAFGAGGAPRALGVSVLVASASTLLAIVLGWPLARALAERRISCPTPVVVLLALPLLVPAYATGVGLSEWFLRLGLADTIPGLVLAHLTVVLPYVVIVLTPGFKSAVIELEEMARTVGAGRIRRLATVLVPAVRPSLVAAAALGFLVSFSQYGISLAVGGGTPTLPIVLVPFVRTDPQVAAAIALVFLAPTLALMALVARASRTPI